MKPSCNLHGTRFGYPVYLGPPLRDHTGLKLFTRANPFRSINSCLGFLHLFCLLLNRTPTVAATRHISRVHRTIPRKAAPRYATDNPIVPSNSTATGAVGYSPKFSPKNVMKYFGGPVLTSPITVHLIYYGAWKRSRNLKKDSGQHLLRKFINSIGVQAPTGPGSVDGWWQITRLYHDRKGTPVTDKVLLGREVFDSYSAGSVLTDGVTAVQQIITRQFRKGKLQPKTGSAYLVLTSPDVHEGGSKFGFCRGYCGWHNVGYYDAPGPGNTIPYYFSFVGNAARQCPKRCGVLSPSPNNNPGIDAMISVVAHELSEIATDPDTISGWLTSQSLSDGLEGADLCTGNLGSPKTAQGTSGVFRYNLIGSDDAKFMVQTNYNPVQAKCTLSV